MIKGHGEISGLCTNVVSALIFTFWPICVEVDKISTVEAPRDKMFHTDFQVTWSKVKVKLLVLIIIVVFLISYDPLISINIKKVKSSESRSNYQLQTIEISLRKSSSCKHLFCLTNNTSLHICPYSQSFWILHQTKSQTFLVDNYIRKHIMSNGIYC